MTAHEMIILATAMYALLVTLITITLIRYKDTLSAWQDKQKSKRETLEALPFANFADFPEPPEGMQVHVHRSRQSVKITWFRTISTAWNNAHKCGIFLVVVPFFFSTGLIPFYDLVRVFHQDDDAVTLDFLPHWAALSLTVLLLVLFSLVCSIGVAGLLIAAYQMTPERSYWMLEISEDYWRASIDRPDTSDSEPSTEVRELIPSHVTQIGVDVGGRVYCEESTERKGQEVVNRVELTPMLSKTEAAWLEEALRSMLNLAPSYVIKNAEWPNVSEKH